MNNGDRAHTTGGGREVNLLRKAVPAPSIHYSDGPMHGWFSLTYASYLVVPRSIIQEMPCEWQQRLVDLLDEMNEKYGGHLVDKRYAVQDRDERGRFQSDELASYRHGPKIEENPWP